MTTRKQKRPPAWFEERIKSVVTALVRDAGNKMERVDQILPMPSDLEIRGTDEHLRKVFDTNEAVAPRSKNIVAKLPGWAPVDEAKGVSAWGLDLERGPLAPRRRSRAMDAKDVAWIVADAESHNAMLVAEIAAIDSRIQTLKQELLRMNSTHGKRSPSVARRIKALELELSLRFETAARTSAFDSYSRNRARADWARRQGPVKGPDGGRPKEQDTAADILLPLVDPLVDPERLDAKPREHQRLYPWATWAPLTPDDAFHFVDARARAVFPELAEWRRSKRAKEVLKALRKRAKKQ